MVRKFQKSLNLLLFQEDRLLLAVSGGMDSIMLCHLCHEIGLNFGIAHCNFQLRGEESNGDEALVAALAKEMDVPYFVTRFDTNAIHKKQKGSTQMLARDLRYEWLEGIRAENNYQYIATAHHLNDSLETSIYNLAKGTGVRGLKGISSKNNNIVRPLFQFTRNELETLVKEWSITYREDSSNASDKYARNKIRHHVIPILKEINPSVEKTFLQTSENLKETELLLDFLIGQIEDDIISKRDNYIYINKNKLNKYPSQKTILFEILKEYHFNNDQIDNLLEMMNGLSGKQLLSNTHKLINDRNDIIISSIHNENEINEININMEDKFFKLENGVKWDFSKHFFKDILSMRHDHDQIHLFDYDKLRFPLKLRKRRTGDYFYPLGMKGKKKLKKYFIDNKYDNFKKENTWILESDGNICAILGDRIDDRFKMENTTKSVLLLRKVNN
jgi:tRNA(Ile)-lysidine synthase